jgi:hypothetical protein
MKKVIAVALVALVFLSSCSKDDSGNGNISSSPKVYKVAYQASCLSNTVENVSSYGMYIAFDTPSFTPIANKWYKDQTGNYFYFKIVDITPVQGQASHRILLSQHFSTYCQ